MGYLSLGVDDVCDNLGGMPTSKVELVSSMSSRTIRLLYVFISAHLSSHGSWGIGLDAAALFGAQKRSRMNIIRSQISSLSSNKAEEE